MSKVRNKKTNFDAIGKLLRFAKPYVPAILLALFFSILQIVATLFAPVIIGKTVDFIIGKNNVDFSVIAKNAGILAGLIAAVLLFQYLSSLCINFASFRTIRDLRREAFKKLNVVPLSYIDSNSHGDLMSRVGNDVDQISDGLIQGFSQLFGGIVTIVGTLVFMLTYNWLIAVIVVVLTPISLFVAYFIAKGCHDTFAKQAEKRGELSGLVTEMTSNQRVVKLFGYEKRAEERFAVINRELKISGQNAAFFSALVNPCTRFVNNVIYAVVCILGAWLVIRGQGILGMGAFTVGGLSCVLSYAIQYTKPFNEITGVVTELQTATAAADRVFNLLETENQSSDEGFPDLENVKGNIEIDNVYFSYVKSNPLIQGFSLSDTCHFLCCKNMGYQIELGKQDRINFSQPDKVEAEPACGHSEQKIQQQSRACPEADHECSLSADCILLPVAEVVDHQQGVNNESAGKRNHKDCRVPAVSHDVEGTSYGNKAEENEHQYISPSVIGQRIRTGRIEKGEYDTGQTYGNHFPSSVA